MPALLANATRNIVEPHAAALDACRAAMEAAGVGTDPRNGHVHVLRRMADSMRAEAAMGKVPSSWHDGPVYASADTARKPLTQLPQRLDASAIADVLERIDLPLPMAVLALAASGMPLGSTGHKISIAELDKALSATPLTTADKIRLKSAMTANGLFPAERRISSQARL